jgi:uncharacterized protein (DUF849 family)
MHSAETRIPRGSMPFLQAALNGDRDHSATPRTPDEFAAEAVAEHDPR